MLRRLARRLIPAVAAVLGAVAPGGTGAQGPAETLIAESGEAVAREVEARRGDTLMRLALRGGAGRAEADAALRALGRHFDPTALQIGQRLQVVLVPGAEPRLLALSLELGPERHVVAQRGADGAFLAHRSDSPAVSGLAAARPPLLDLGAILDEMGGDGARVDRFVIARGDTLMDLVVEAGATLTEADRSTRELGRHFDPRRLQIGHALYVVRVPNPARSGTRSLGLLVLDAAERGHVAVFREDGGFVGRRFTDAAEVAVLDRFAADADAAPAPDFESRVRVERVTLGAGDTLMSMLTRAGASRAEADRAIRALRPHHNLRRLQIGQAVHAAFDKAGGEGWSLVSVSIEIERDLYVQANLQGRRFVAGRTDTPVNPVFARPAAAELERAPAEAAPPAETAALEAEAGVESAVETDPAEADAEADAVAVAAPKTDADAEAEVALAVEPAAPAAAVEPETVLRGRAEQFWFEIRPGDTIGAVLRELTRDAAEISRITRAISAKFDPRRLKVGQQIVAVVERGADGDAIAALSLGTGESDTLVVMRTDDNAWRARRATSHVDLSDFTRPEAEPSAPPRPWPEMPGDAVRTGIEIAAGDTLMNGLARLGIDRAQADAAIDVMRETFNPRTIRAGQEIAIAHRGAALFGIALAPRPGERIEVALDEDGYRAREVVVPLARSVAAMRGTIRSSLYQAAQDAGVPIPVLADMIRAFSFDVDFQREVHAGDGFEVLFETFSDSDGEIVRYGAPLYAVLNVSDVTLPIYRYRPASGFTDYFNDRGESVRKALLRTPLDGARVTSGFGMRKHPILGYSRLHKGVDFGAPSGTPVLAAGDGVIEALGRKGNYGRYIRIRHNASYESAYAHLRSYARGLARGSRVRQGEVIGQVGSSGLSTGPHLHYEVLVDGRAINPLDLKLPSGEVLTGAELEKFYAERDRLDALFAERLERRDMARAE